MKNQITKINAKNWFDKNLKKFHVNRAIKKPAKKSIDRRYSFLHLDTWCRAEYLYFFVDILKKVTKKTNPARLVKVQKKIDSYRLDEVSNFVKFLVSKNKLKPSLLSRVTNFYA